jgi:hypothetical protein
MTEKVAPDKDDNLRQSDDDPRNRVRPGKKVKVVKGEGVEIRKVRQGR